MFNRRQTFAALPLLVALLLLLPAPTALAEPYSLPKVQALAAKHTNISALVVDLNRGRILASHQPDNRLTPASVSKIYIDAAALEHWGPGYRFYTRVLSNGKLKHGVLDGDLMLRGAGDPELTANRLWLLVSRLKQLGIREVTGDLIINDSLFGPIPCDNKDRCDALEAGDNGYDAPLSAAGIGYAVTEITIVPGEKIGDKARIEILPPGMPHLPVDGEIDTVSSKKRPLYGVRRIKKDGVEVLSAYGRVPAGGGPYRIYRSVSDPSRHTGQVMLTLLGDAGIKVKGKLRVSSASVPKEFDNIEALQSSEMTHILRDMMLFSNNYMADVLTLGLTARQRNGKPMTLPEASVALENLAHKANTKAPKWLQPQRTPAKALNIDGGSGLNPDNRFSARDVVALLKYMYDQPDLFPSFLGSLSVPEHVSSRMLRRWANPDWKKRVAAKTGYLSEPRGVVAVAGYFRLKNGGFGAFGFIANGTKKKRSVSASTAIGSFREDMQKIMAEM